jgi:hypothetical protein
LKLLPQLVDLEIVALLAVQGPVLPLERLVDVAHLLLRRARARQELGLGERGGAQAGNRHNDNDEPHRSLETGSTPIWGEQSAHKAGYVPHRVDPLQGDGRRSRVMCNPPNGNYRHGQFTREAIAERRQLLAWIREMAQLAQEVG